VLDDDDKPGDVDPKPRGQALEWAVLIVGSLGLLLLYYFER
jgi:hypothetical protein